MLFIILLNVLLFLILILVHDVVWKNLFGNFVQLFLSIPVFQLF